MLWSRSSTWYHAAHPSRRISVASRMTSERGLYGNRFAIQHRARAGRRWPRSSPGHEPLPAMSGFDAARNLGLKAVRRLQAVPKPFVRLMRRRARSEEHRAFRLEAETIDQDIARLAAGRHPIVAGPWLTEVGYEVLYWIPFLRWFQDAFGITRDRLVVVSRGGMEAAYREIAASYVDIFDVMTPAELAARNAERRSSGEGGGQKQSSASSLDNELLAAARSRLGWL